MSPLDPSFRLRDDDLVEHVPFFDDLYRYTVRHGSTMIPDLIDYLNQRDEARKERERKENTQTFSVLCSHGLPHNAYCELCDLGVFSFSEEKIIEGKVLRVYGKNLKWRRRWYRRLWYYVRRQLHI